MDALMKKISVVIPALNEEKGIGSVIDQVPVKKITDMGYEIEILVVDNGSTDRTSCIAQAHGAKVMSETLRGYGNAYKSGFKNAAGDIIITGDADMTYPFDAIPKFLSIMSENNADFINTDRLSNLDPKAMTSSHEVGNFILSLIMRYLFHWPFNDSQSGMWIFKRDIWKYLDVRSEGMSFSQELKIEAYIKGFKCIEVPIEYRARVGKVKLNAFKDGLGNITQLFKKRFAA